MAGSDITFEQFFSNRPYDLTVKFSKGNVAVQVTFKANSTPQQIANIRKQIEQVLGGDFDSGQMV